MNLPGFAVKRPLTVLMFFLAIFLFGVISLSKLGIDMLPEIEPPAISVIVPYPGASASDVENDVTVYLEDQLSVVNNLDKLSSSSKDNISVVTCQFKWGTDLNAASNDVRDKLDLAKSDIKEHAPGSQEPLLFKFSSAVMPVMVVTISADKSWPQLYHIMDKQISDPLKRVKGVGMITAFGGLRRQIKVQFNWQKLEAYNLSPLTIIAALKGENLDMPSGDVEMGKRKYYIRVAGKFDSIEEIKNVIVGMSKGKPIYLKNIAEVEDSFERQMMKGWSNDRDAIVLLIQKQSGANTVEVCKDIKKFLGKIKKDLPPDVNITVPIDNSEFILNAIGNLTNTLIVAGILVILVALLFLRKTLASIIISLSIPFSLICAFIFLFVNGFTINIISLMSLAIAIGMVVDNAIVVLENITRHIDSGEKPEEAAVFATKEVAPAITASALTTIVVFIPLIFVSGIAGVVFKQLGFIISITILASLLIALTLTPMLSSRWLKPSKRNHKNKAVSKFFLWGEAVFGSIENIYERILNFSLTNKKKILLPLVLIFIFSLGSVKFMGTSFFPDLDTGELSITFLLSENSRIKETEKIALKVAEFYKKFIPETRDYYSFVGESKKGTGLLLGMDEGANVGTSGTKLVSKNHRKRSAEEVANVLRSKIKEVPGIEKVSVSATTPIKRMLLGGGKQIEVEIIGHSLTETNKLAKKLKQIMEKIPGATDTRISRKKQRFEMLVKVDRQKAAQLGVNVASVATVLRSNYYGFTASKFRDAGDDFDIFVQLKEEDRKTLDNIGDINIPSMNGSLIKLKNISKIKESLGPVSIERKNRERIVKVGCDVYNRPLGDVKNDIEKAMSNLNIPPGITVELGGEAEEQKKAFDDLFLLLCVGITLVYMVLVSQFESFKTPFIIFFSVPFTFIGVIWALLLTQNTLNLMSFMALIMLMGVVVNYAIVLVDYANILRARGLSLTDAIKQAGKHRLRPVLMSSFSAIFAMLPLAILSGEGSEMWQPFGITAVGGLLVSTIVTLVLVPVIYVIFNKEKKGKI